MITLECRAWVHFKPTNEYKMIYSGNLLEGDNARKFPFNSEGNLVLEVLDVMKGVGVKDLFEKDLVEYEGKTYTIEYMEEDAGFYIRRNLVQHGENEDIRMTEDVIYLLNKIGNVYES